jgi:hypothetical protein
MDNDIFNTHYIKALTFANKLFLVNLVLAQVTRSIVFQDFNISKTRIATLLSLSMDQDMP